MTLLIFSGFIVFMTAPRDKSNSQQRCAVFV
jgi:hypothetical protein